MVKKRGDRRTPIKIIPSNSLLNKRNIIFLLVALLLVILIVYFLIRAWPIMKERLGDEDNDGIKNYEDKCSNTPLGVTIDEYGCEISKEAIHKESPRFIEEEEEPEEKTDIVCSDSDGGKDIWNKGTCKDSKENKDYCKENFGIKLYEFECSNNICDKSDIDCSDYNALCYDGRCIDKNKDTDKDGYPDIDEYDKGTDPNNPNDNLGNMTIQSNCNSRCINLGYVSGRGPFNSIGYCNSPEVGQYVSGNSGDVCCCMPASTGYYSFQQCLSLQNNHGADFSQRQETDWTQSSCQAYASPRCNATNIGFDRNCCWWSCYVEVQLTYEQMCQQWMIVTGGSYWILGLSSSQACYDKAVQDCANKGQQYSLSMYQNPTTGCCSWKCKEKDNPNKGLACSSTAVTPSSQADCNLRSTCPSAPESFCEYKTSPNRCVCSWVEDCHDIDYESGLTGLDIWKTKSYCYEDGGNQNWDTCVNGKLKEWTCGFTEACTSFEAYCADWIEGGYCDNGACKSGTCKNLAVLNGYSDLWWTGGTWDTHTTDSACHQRADDACRAAAKYVDKYSTGGIFGKCCVWQCKEYVRPSPAPECPLFSVFTRSVYSGCTSHQECLDIKSNENACFVWMPTIYACGGVGAYDDKPAGCCYFGCAGG